MRLNVSLLLLFIFAGVGRQPASAQSAAPLVVMNLAAHPDDEDGRTLTYYRKADDAIAYSVIYTRGEGGQNEIGPELYEELGAIRTQETERAARQLGTQVYFLNFKDFGFSKQASEAFEKWGGRDEVTSRIVYLVRKLKPDVMFTNHDTLTVGPNLQHGQHQAVGISAYDAFALASDPTYHPEQLEEDGVDLWQPKRLFLRLWRRTDQPYDAEVPVTDMNAAAGKSYGDIATDALREHASQGMGMFAAFRRMQDNTFFVLLREADGAPPITSDLASNLPANRSASPDLSYWIASGRIEPAPEGFFTLSTAVAVPGQQVEVRFAPMRMDAPPMHLTFTGAIDTTLVLSAGSDRVVSLRVRPDAAATLPRVERQYDRFTNDPPVTYTLRRGDAPQLVAAGHLPLEIAPPIVVTASEQVMRLRGGANALALNLDVMDPKATQVAFRLAVSSDGARDVLHTTQQTVQIAGGDRRAVTLDFDLPSSLPEGDYTVAVTGMASPATGPATPSHTFVKGRVFNVLVPENLHVGVVASYDNTLDQALTQLGVDHVLLDSLTLAEGDLTAFQTILVDIRAYLVRADLRAYNDRLLDWVSAGGHLIVNYQKTFEWNAEFADPFDASKKNPDNLAPYPLVLSHDRVTREDAEVTVLMPESPLFHKPNAISASLWDGWVQERGLYFPGEYDARYHEVFSMHDPGEAPMTSSTLLAEYGNGTYLYTALGWYRQLKEFHPEVYAFFANMISLPLTDERDAKKASNLE
ncbi:MAG: PIG-L family deacetylase [Rhodothermales bacterium]